MRALSVFLAFFSLLVAACSTGDRQQRLAQLEELERQNVADSLMTNDSLALALADFFDRHGTPNERMRAHYILGRTYADLGEAPKALECFYNAVSCVNNSISEKDYRTLIGLHGQMSVIFHQQNLPNDEIKAIEKYAHYALMSGDTISYLHYKGHLIAPYYLLGKKDTVLQIIETVNKELERRGCEEMPFLSLGTAAYIYLQRGQTDKAYTYLYQYEHEAGLSDNDGVIQSGWESFYWIKGFYELQINQVDSAEFYFRKAIQYGDYETVSNAYKGMLEVYQRKRNIDSIAHYSKLNEIALDSLHNNMRTNAIHQASALYDYTRSQKLAEREAQKRREAWYWFAALSCCIIIFSCFLFLQYRKKQRRKRNIIHHLSGELIAARSEYKSMRDELRMLKSKNYENLVAEKSRKCNELELRIAELEKEKVMLKPYKLENHFDEFKSSTIVEVFAKKARFTKDHPVPNKAEWNALSSQFMKDMPAVWQFIFDNKKLSPLELNTCILLILDYEEGVIVGLTQTSSQAVSIAKRRANKKLFNETSAITLKYNLKKLC